MWYSLVSALIYHLYLVHDLFLNDAVFLTINYLLILAMVIILTISRAGWKIAPWINKWTIDVCTNKHEMDTITRWILQHLLWMLQQINECCNKRSLLWYFLFYQLFLSLTILSTTLISSNMISYLILYQVFSHVLVYE